MSGPAVTRVDLPLPKIASGKVREMFDLGGDDLLIVATDRISAYDVVMPQGIPDKGRLLTGMSAFWFDLVADISPHHLISVSMEDLRPGLAGYEDVLDGRFMIVRRLEMLPVEFVIRGYLVGSGWKEYRESGTVCGIRLPPGLQHADRLPEPIFTPATKAKSGHDVNITEEEAADLCGAYFLRTAKERALEVYERAANLARARGVIIADTKFEFGVDDYSVVLADEVLTPDSSRFWPADAWAPGTTPPSLDKQFLRDWLDGSGWDHNPPPPDLPPQVVERTREGYVRAYEQVTARPFAP